MSAAQHDDSNHMMPNLVCTDEDAAIFWDWLKSQSLVPKQRTNPQPAPADGVLPAGTFVQITVNRDDFNDCRGIIIYNGDWRKDSTYQVAVIGYEDSLVWYTSEEFTVISRPSELAPSE